jgi:hypothetical protein
MDKQEFELMDPDPDLGLKIALLFWGKRVPYFLTFFITVMERRHLLTNSCRWLNMIKYSFFWPECALVQQNLDLD